MPVRTPSSTTYAPSLPWTHITRQRHSQQSSCPSHFRPLRGPSRSLCCLLSPASSCSSSNSIIQDSLHRPPSFHLAFLRCSSLKHPQVMLTHRNSYHMDPQATTLWSVSTTRVPKEPCLHPCLPTELAHEVLAQEAQCSCYKLSIIALHVQAPRLLTCYFINGLCRNDLFVFVKTELPIFSLLYSREKFVPGPSASSEWPTQHLTVLTPFNHSFRD